MVAFQGVDTTIHLQLCSFSNGNLVPVLEGSINDERTMINASLNDWDIVPGILTVTDMMTLHYYL